MKFNTAQKAWLKSYKQLTGGFEAMHQDEFRAGEISFYDLAVSNIHWFQNWAGEIVQQTYKKIPEKDQLGGGK